MIDNLYDYCDYDNGTIINYLDYISKDLSSLKKIEKIFLSVKNSIEYDMFSSIQRASETLVMGRGNNLDKNLLLYVLLKESGFDANIYCANVKDKSKTLINRDNKIIPWYYIKVMYFGKVHVMDCSFDSSYMRAAGIRNYGNYDRYLISDYIYNSDKLFEVYDEKCITIETQEKENIILNGSEKFCI